MAVLSPRKPNSSLICLKAIGANSVNTVAPFDGGEHGLARLGLAWLGVETKALRWWRAIRSYRRQSPLPS